MGWGIKVKKIFFGEETKPKIKRRKTEDLDDLLAVFDSDDADNEIEVPKKKLKGMNKTEKAIVHAMNA